MTRVETIVLKEATKNVASHPKATKETIRQTLHYAQADQETQELIDSLTPRGLARVLNVWRGTKTMDEMLIEAFVNGNGHEKRLL